MKTKRTETVCLHNLVKGSDTWSWSSLSSEACSHAWRITLLCKAYLFLEILRTKNCLLNSLLYRKHLEAKILEMVDHPDSIRQSRERLMWFSWIIPQVTLPQYFFLFDSPCFLQLQSTRSCRFNPHNCIFNPLFQGVQTLKQQANSLFSNLSFWV